MFHNPFNKTIGDLLVTTGKKSREEDALIIEQCAETGPKDLTDSDMEQLYDVAHRQAYEAGSVYVPETMFVTSRVLDEEPKRYAVPEGPCGFAWVRIKPGNSRFARWLVASKIGRRDEYEGGVVIWVSYYNQSHQRKAEYAHVMAKIFRSVGIKAEADDRMD